MGSFWSVEWRMVLVASACGDARLERAEQVPFPWLHSEPQVAGGWNMQANVLWIIAVVIAVIGVIVLISGSVLWGIILLVIAALVGPGGYSIFNRRA